MAGNSHFSGLSPIRSPIYTMGRAVGKAQRAAGPGARFLRAPSERDPTHPLVTQVRAGTGSKAPSLSRADPILRIFQGIF